MSDTAQAPQIPVKVDQRKVMTEEKLERLRLARETRARNRIAKEEKRMEMARQFILASAGGLGKMDPGPGMSTQTVKMLNEKTSAEEKKLKWEARKNEMIQEMIQKLEANALATKRSKEPPIQPEESESEISDEPPAKRPKKSKKAVAKPPQKSKKSSSRTATSARAPKKRRPVEPAVSSTSESDSESDVEHENVLQLW